MAMPTTLYTLGYQKRDLDEFIELLRGARVDVLVDVRETAWSHKPGFSKSSFSKGLAAAGIEYVHARFAGNPKSLRAAARSHAACLERYASYVDANREIIEALERLVDDLVKRDKQVCLTCFERHADDCHRGILAERWRRRGRRRVSHLAVDGCARLISA